MLCYSTVVKETEIFYDCIVTLTIGMWVPAIMLLTLHVVMYRKLQQQALMRKHSSTLDSTRQMRSIFRTFSIIIISFFICILPLSFLQFTIYYLLFSGQQKVLDAKANLLLTMQHIFICLQDVNSCLNPLIYGKVHHKIYSVMKNTWKCVARCSRSKGITNFITFCSTTNKITCNQLKNGQENKKSRTQSTGIYTLRESTHH